MGFFVWIKSKKIEKKNSRSAITTSIIEKQFGTTLYLEKRDDNVVPNCGGVNKIMAGCFKFRENFCKRMAGCFNWETKFWKKKGRQCRPILSFLILFLLSYVYKNDLKCLINIK